MFLFLKITSAWLLRWRHDYQVSLRLPNRRWKVPLHVLRERVECTWLNIIRVRRLFQLVFGYDPDIEGVDQQPMHFNESRSRMKKALAWAGQSDVPLKECVAQTRERWTMNTRAFQGAPGWSMASSGNIIQRWPGRLCKGGAYVQVPLRWRRLRASRVA